MSYKTNPISNRLKVIKGWKTPYLPTKTLNYSRDISLWFKVYLLLKTFLNLKKIQLLFFDFRSDQQNKKIVYLVINKKKTQRKKRKKKKIVLKKFKTPLQKHKNKNSIFFLYQNLEQIKQSSFWNQNFVHKKILSKFWITKPKISSWINTFEKIIKIRQNSQKKFKYLKKNQVFTPIQHLQLKFYTNKQKQILAQKLRLQKTNTIFYAKIFELLQQKKSQFLLKVINNLKKKINKNQFEIKKMNIVSKFLLFLDKKASEKKNLKKKLMFTQIHRNKLTVLQKMWMNAAVSLNRTRFLKQKVPAFVLKNNKKIFPNIDNVQGRILKKDSLLKKILHLNFLTSQILSKNFLLKNSLLRSKFQFALHQKITKKKKIDKNNLFLENLQRKTLLKSKFNRILKKKQFDYFFHRTAIFFLLRLKKKKKKIKKSRFRNQKLKFNLKKKLYQKYIFFLGETKLKDSKIPQQLKEINRFLKKNQEVRKYQYRIPYKKSYFNFIQFTTQLKLKYLIQNLIQKYFSFQVEAKIIHFLNAHKNKNYFRLVFPVWKKKKNQLLRKFRQKNWKQKQIFLTSQLQVVTPTQKLQKVNPKKTLFTNHTRKCLKKKDFYILARKKIKNKRIQNSFKRIKGNKDFRHSFKYFIPTLMYFSKTLNPQPLADLLSKIVYKAKKQTWMLNTIKDILKIIKLGKNVGYKIALAGRINSSDKSRLIYLTRKNVPLQVFDKNMNFAYSQAKARIGVFGIKIWVYF